jgi:hypothetical protein
MKTFNTPTSILISVPETPFTAKQGINIIIILMEKQNQDINATTYLERLTTLALIVAKDHKLYYCKNSKLFP